MMDMMETKVSPQPPQTASHSWQELFLEKERHRRARDEQEQEKHSDHTELILSLAFIERTAQMHRLRTTSPIEPHRP